MKLYHATDVPERGPGLLCRQSRFWGIVRFVVFLAVLPIPIYMGWQANRPFFLWCGVAMAALVGLLLIVDMRALFRHTNWALRIDPDGLWINLCSYRDRVPDMPSVAFLSYSEIASVGKHTEGYTTPSEQVNPGSYGKVGGSTVWKCHFLEIRLAHEQTDELAADLNKVRREVRSHFCPVWMVSPSVLRIHWLSGHGPVLSPRIAQALSQLAVFVQVVEPTRRQRPDWSKLTPEEADELARELVQIYGDSITPGRVLVRAGGVPYAEAEKLVGQFANEEVGQSA
jgi:hypothetical protein